MQAQLIPPGLCQCGCGRSTRIADRTYPRKGITKGQPLRYIKGHSGGLVRAERPALRLCACGCGETTTIYGLRPRTYVHGHGGFRAEGRWAVEDRGYETSCWIWQLKTTPEGYGSVRVRGEEMGAHRWSYEKNVGPIPAGLHLDHLCRVPSCINPAHLEPVTQAENTRRGSGAKLTYAAVVEMKRLRGRGLAYKAIGDVFGVDRETARRAVIGESWT